MSTRITDSSDESNNSWLDNKKKTKTQHSLQGKKGENKYITEVGKWKYGAKDSPHSVERSAQCATVQCTLPTSGIFLFLHERLTSFHRFQLGWDFSTCKNIFHLNENLFHLQGVCSCLPQCRAKVFPRFPEASSLQDLCWFISKKYFCPYEQLCHLLLGSASQIQWTEDFHGHRQASQCRELECLPALLLLWPGPLLMVSDLLGRSQNCGGLVQTIILQYVAVDLWMYTTAKLAARLNLPRRASEGTRKGRLLENIWMPRQAIPPITMKPARVRLRPRTLSRVLVKT